MRIAQRETDVIYDLMYAKDEEIDAKTAQLDILKVEYKKIIQNLEEKITSNKTKGVKAKEEKQYITKESQTNNSDELTIKTLQDKVNTLEKLASNKEEKIKENENLYKTKIMEMSNNKNKELEEIKKNNQ